MSEMCEIFCSISAELKSKPWMSQEHSRMQGIHPARSTKSHTSLTECNGQIRGKLGLWALGEAIPIVDLRKRVARKPRRTILLHFGLITFRFAFVETLKPFICMFFVSIFGV